MKKYIIVIAAAFIVACTPTKVITPPQVQAEASDVQSCQFKATLLDYTTNGNCGYLFQLDDGTKLLPSSMPSVDIGFYDRKIVKIGYKSYDEENTETNSKCGVEDKAVEITCIEEYVDPNDNSPKNLEDCAPVKNVYKNIWMPRVADELKPQQILEYDYAIGFLYIFKVGEINHLYDCLGNEMCASDDGGDCNSLIETLGKGKVIQVLKN